MSSLAEPLPETTVLDPSQPPAPELHYFGEPGNQIAAIVAAPGFVFAPKEIAKWVGGNLASGIVGAAGGMLFGAALNAIGLGEPDLQGMLLDISNRLTQVQHSLDEIKTTVDTILRELRELRVSMDQYFGEGKLAEAFTQIDDAYGIAPILHASAGSTTAPSFMELTASLPRSKTTAQLQPYATAFVSAENDKWKLTTQITSIHDALTSQVGHGSSLLERWSNGLILAVHDKQLSLQAAYTTLEGYFMQAVSKQLQAVAMHCFVLGGDTARIQYFVQTSFGTHMHNQTAEFLRCVEKLVLGNMRLLKVPSVYTMSQSSEFPGEMEAIFLHADLLCAALNLVSKTTTLSNKQAVAGIYGRVLARPSDLGTGATPVGPATKVGSYAEIRGTVGKAVTNLRSIDLRADGSKLLLGEQAGSAPVFVRYYWPWPTTLPPQGVAIDTRFRGGVAPAYYNIFDDNDWPLAAAFVDFGRVLLGAPATMPSRLLENTQFRAADAHSVIHQSAFVPPPLHPLTRPAANQLEWRFDHAWKCEGTWLRNSTFYLFEYTGKPARIRLHLDVFCEVEHHRGSPTWGDNDMNARLTLVKKDGPRNTFYNSEFAGDGALYLIHRGVPYKRSVGSWPPLEFEITPGEYALALEFKSWVGDRTWFENYNGWNFDSLKFSLNGVYAEWI